MNSLRFEWDARKATANLKKHGISFEEAKSAFYDEQAKLIDDPDHSADEERFILLGLSFSLRLVVVCHCYRVQMMLFALSLQEKPRPTRRNLIKKVIAMRDEYDFSKARKNPYSTQLKKSITIRLDEDSVGYFKAISEEVGIPYQTLINLYLRDCATSHRKLNLNWK